MKHLFCKYSAANGAPVSLDRLSDRFEYFGISHFGKFLNWEHPQLKVPHDTFYKKVVTFLLAKT